MQDTSGTEQRFEFTVDVFDSDLRLDVWLHRQMPDRSRVFLQKLIREGHVELHNPRPIATPKLNYRMQPGDRVKVTVPPAVPTHVEPEEMPLDVLYEDVDLIVLNKPPGLVVHPAVGHWEHTLVNALLHHCRGQLSGIGGVERPGIVHRLDQDTSGCIVVAKNDTAHHRLQDQFQSRDVQKVYLAFVWGVPGMAKGRIQASIGRSPFHRQKMAVLSEGGREAVTDYEVQRVFKDISLVRCTLHTGRTHQIRVHLASIGHPIVGDNLYGRSRKHPLTQLVKRQMLHAHILAFHHPRTNKRLEFSAPLPQDMEELIQRLEREADVKREANGS